MAVLLAEEYEVVVRPDHPFLLDPPDLMVLSPAGLTAAFVLKASERRSPDDLLARLVAARLALPLGTRFPLVAPEGPGGPWQADAVRSNFHGVFGAEDVEAVRSFVRDQSAQDDPDRHLQEAKRFALKRYGDFLSASRRNVFGLRLLRESVEPPDPPDFAPTAGVRYDTSYSVLDELIDTEDFRVVGVPRWTGQEIRTPRQGPLLQRDGALVGALDVRSTGNGRETLRRACRDILQSTFSLDTSVPYPRRGATSVLIVDGLPLDRLDPEKPARAAAFAGWTMAEPRTAEGLLRVIERLQSQRGERSH